MRRSIERERIYKLFYQRHIGSRLNGFRLANKAQDAVAVHACSYQLFTVRFIISCTSLSVISSTNALSTWERDVLPGKSEYWLTCCSEFCLESSRFSNFRFTVMVRRFRLAWSPFWIPTGATV